MYHTAAPEVLANLKTLVEDCISVPLILHAQTGRSLNASRVYQETDEQDEVQDLYLVLLATKQRFPKVEAIAILST